MPRHTFAIIGDGLFKLSGESASGTFVNSVGPTLNASPTPGTPGSGNLLGINSSGQVVTNGVAQTGTAGVFELYYVNHTAYQLAVDDSWYGPITATSTGAGVSAPVVTITGISLSSTSFPVGASGTVIGAISVTASGGSFTGSLSVSGTNASSFQIVGGNLETNGTVTAGSYSINIVATQSGAALSPSSVAFTITASGAPSQAAAAGFTTLVFDDEFNANSISYNGSYTGSGQPNWYVQEDSGGNQVATSANAYVSGGLLNLVGITDANNNSTLGTVAGSPYFAPNCPISMPGSHQTNTGYGVSFIYGYFEARIKYVSTGTNNGSSPAFWGVNAFTNNYSGQLHGEIDFLEADLANSPTVPGNPRSTIWQWPAGYNDSNGVGNGSCDITNLTANGWNLNNYNTYGCLWTSTGVTFYVNNVVSQFSSGINSTVALPTDAYGNSFTGILASATGGSTGTIGFNIILGTGPDWDVYVDWVRIWQ